ncbi:MAG: asparagine synthase (glutamine-hydrolyzing) [Alphaproteobacteria bacterium 16-39-46]|nr:MAG: asparagine synthase (glutamine-hydrolyzing) [Alphaproteobacteria bacterium 16-39-46]OZA44207.1 MAG: asparagine synthase (glutamine-hydrolyzing) [Alphaproteobacteria bacterium 17-39-52]HQS83663.1 asparagine synthase (glutamine-hydrolyzing) [Alphaproteobacteria bacterium]HQS93407.1 asparagine synthase (glutamine-hydrolyzing) [Alphaproteobacteria bacterium]
MCGFTGFWSRSPLAKESLEKTAALMAHEISFRGPNSTGFWTDERNGLVFAHLRLAIIDLNDTGNQPMVSASKRFVISYNGEVYNYGILRKELEERGVSFKGSSDTEVMLAAIEAWGLEDALSKFIGMFAFALWDTQDQRLFLVRDRLGVKPLYYGIINNVLFFGSQPRSFMPHPLWKSTLNQNALSDYFVYSYVPGTESIFQGLQKVAPGHIVSIDASFTPKISCYWNLTEKYHHGLKNPLKLSETNTIDHLEVLLKDAVKLRMISDVPLGAFLSGGIDSSLVVALMQKQSINAIKTFSIGFSEDTFNEAPFAKKIAEHLGTDHFEYILREKDALEIIPNLPEFYDEPFADSSQIPTFLVSKMAREHVTVSLSGDGGDEFFCGYTRYGVGNSLKNLLRFFPVSLRPTLSALLRVAAKPHLEKLVQIFSSQTHLSHKLNKLSDLIMMQSPFEIYHSLLIHFSPKEAELITGHRASFSESLKKIFSSAQNFTEAMQLTDISLYLPDDILTKVDRASMAHSLEAREPLLDHRIAEFSFALPLSFKLKQNQGKWILRQVLKRYVPESYFDRPKQGFGLPIDQWLRGDLKDWANELLSLTALKDSGLSNALPIRTRWEEHLSQTRNWQYSLWGVLMYQAWHQRYFKNNPFPKP